MDLFEIDDTQRVRREEAAVRLHALADALARNNAIEFQRGYRYHGRLLRPAMVKVALPPEGHDSVASRRRDDEDEGDGEDA